MTEDTKKPAEDIADDDLDQVQGGVNIARGRTTGEDGTTFVNINNEYHGIGDSAVNINNEYHGTDDVAVNINNEYKPTNSW